MTQKLDFLCLIFGAHFETTDWKGKFRTTGGTFQSVDAGAADTLTPCTCITSQALFFLLTRRAPTSQIPVPLPPDTKNHASRRSRARRSRRVLGRSKFRQAVHQTSAERLIMKRGYVLFPGAALPRTTGRRQGTFQSRPSRSGE